MKKLIFAAFAGAICLLAADFWQSKSFEQWSDKDVQKMLDNSPWSKQVTIPGEIAAMQGTGKRRGMPGSMGEANSSTVATPGAMEDSSARARPSEADPMTGQTPGTTLMVRWESALPVKQARVKARYGLEAATSPEAKKILETNENAYVISVSGLGRGAARGDSDALKKQAMADAALMVKGKDPIKPVNFMLQRVNNGVVAVFAFPKTEALAIEDKEVEFRAKLDSMTVQSRFQLKNMIIGGKLEL